MLNLPKQTRVSKQKKTRIKTFAICTDSFSFLQNLQKSYSTNSIIQQIQEKIHLALTTLNTKATFLWVPSNVGIRRNKETTRLEIRKAVSHLPITYEYLYLTTKQKISEKVQAMK